MKKRHNSDIIKKPAVRQLFKIFGDDIRLVGGCVRDLLAGHEMGDMDFATTLKPAAVIKKLKSHRIKCIPTGLDHGTVTAVVYDKGYEITTLRKDVATDGRHAKVAFTDDWKIDASRRDFTINALYMDKSGAVYDYFDGQKDLKAKRVRFIGDAGARIQEDYLRILRFFRFSARFGRAPFDKKALVACRQHLKGLDHLSRERIGQEVIKWFGTADPIPTIKAAESIGVFKNIFGLSKVNINRARHVSSLGCRDSLIILAALIGPRDGERIADNLRLSNAQKKLLIAWSQTKIKPTVPAVKEALYYHGPEKTHGWILLSGTKKIKPLMRVVQTWKIPTFSITGHDLIKKGMTPGPQLGQRLRKLELNWVKSGFKKVNLN